MNRLEEELRLALRREPAPAGFVEKVVDRVAREPMRPRSRLLDRWRRALLGWFEFSPFGMRAAVAAAVILLAVGLFAFWLTRSGQRTRTSTPQETAQTPPQNPTQPGTVDKGSQSTVGDERIGSDRSSVKNEFVHSASKRRTHQESKLSNASERIQHHPSTEAEAAKEQVMLALQIASSTLGDARRSVQEEDSRRSR
jgi:hypothetical protein